MGPKPAAPESGELFISRLDELINLRHPLVRLALNDTQIPPHIDT